MDKQDLQAGIDLLAKPVLPLVSMVQFLFLTGPFERVEEVIDEMPEPVETGYCLYDTPREQLRTYLDHLRLLENLKTGKMVEAGIVDETNQPVDTMTGCASLVSQRVLEQELEAINSVLCAPCHCTLCCIGPDRTMQQEFFEIPLQEEEQELFAVDRIDSADSRNRRAMDDDELQLDGAPFYRRDKPGLVHWQTGWSLILPRETTCPGLAPDGRCRVYDHRPRVCRRPQIFSYILEKTERDNCFRLRNSLLAIIDCPYVKLLREEIAAYGAACELELVLKKNKH